MCAVPAVFYSRVMRRVSDASTSPGCLCGTCVERPARCTCGVTTRPRIPETLISEVLKIWPCHWGGGVGPSQVATILSTDAKHSRCRIYLVLFTCEYDAFGLSGIEEPSKLGKMAIDYRLICTTYRTDHDPDHLQSILYLPLRDVVQDPNLQSIDQTQETRARS